MSATPPRRSCGLALIVAMLVAALTAAVATALLADESLWSSKVAHRRDQVQAQSLARAGIKWARQILATTPGAAPIVTLNDPWALPLPPTPIEGGSVEGRITDAQGLLNLGNLAIDAPGSGTRAGFERLAASLGLPTDAVPRIANWIASRQPLATDSGNGAFVPLVADELAAVPGVPASTLARLAPYVVALPPRTPLNVNTAPAALLAAALQGLGRDEANALVADRRARPFASVADFHSRLPAGTSAGDLARFAVGSEYFLVEVRAQEGDTLADASALVHVREGAVTIVWQRVD
jgi:general secretion pathway protein K